MKYLFIIIALLFIGCELVVDVDVPAQPPKLTVNGAFTEGNTFSVALHKNKYILDNRDYEHIPNAEVSIKEGGQIIDVLHHSQMGNYESSTGATPTAGKTYEIQVAAPGLESVTAQSSLPTLVPLRNAFFEWKNSSGNQIAYSYTIDITFDDPVATEDFYEVEVAFEYERYNPATQDTVRELIPVNISVENPAFAQENINGVMFDDKLINGKENTIRIVGYDVWGSSNDFYVTLRSLSKDLFRYRLTSQLQENLGGDPFAQPVHVHNNINNGFGIFGGYQEHILKATQ